MDNSVDTRESSLAGDERLPAHSFFLALKQNGFSVTPRQVIEANVVIEKYAPVVSNELELCNYISPLFAQNEDEQKQFKELFLSHFGEAANKPVIKQSFSTIAIRHLNKHWIKYAVVLFVVLVAAFFLFRTSAKGYPPDSLATVVMDLTDLHVEEKRVLIFDPTPKTGTGYTMVPANVRTREALSVKLALDETQANTGLRIDTVRINWNDGSPVDTTSVHTYTKEGRYAIDIYVDVLFKGNKFSDSVTVWANVCSAEAGVEIVNAMHVYPVQDVDTVKLGETYRLNALIKGRKPDQFIWQPAADDPVQGFSYETEFLQEGTRYLAWTAVYDSVNSPCTKIGGIYIHIYDPNKIPLLASVGAPPQGSSAIKPKYVVRGIWIKWLVILLLVSFAATRIIALLNKRAKKRIQQHDDECMKKYEELVASFKGKKPPMDLPFRNKNYLPLPLPAMSELSRQMRRRINDDTMYLDLPLTIRKSIVSGGLFQPVNAPRTQQSEYLVLIDEGHKNNQQVKLFEYLTDSLSRQNVHIEKYYYRDNLQHCHNANDPAGMSFEKLSEKYPRNVLIIFGDAYDLLSPHYPVFDNQHLPLLNRWQYKAILTPLPFPDWSGKEIRGLSPTIPVFPVDQEGLLLFIYSIFHEDPAVLPALYQRQFSFYATGKTDFENIDDLAAYCQHAEWARAGSGKSTDNILFQWLAALAVYPKIRWELTLAIGKSILDRYGKTGELNYTNLLRIARIRWMTEGQFPDTMRLDLLKELHKENEVIARETILSLLNEIPDTEIGPAHFAFEEKELQRIINEFNLYSYDSLTYSRYATSEKLFEQLWKNRKIKDSPAKVYFKRKDNEWSTLINKTAPDGSKTNVGIEEYIDPDAASAANNKLYKRAMYTAVMVFGICFWALIALVILNYTNTNLGMFSYSLPREISFTYINNSGDAAYDSGRLAADTMRDILENNKPKKIRLGIDKSAKNLSFITKDKALLDTSIIIDRDAYIITLEKEREPQIPVSIVVAFWLTPDCEKNISEFTQTVKTLRKDLQVIVDAGVVQSASAGPCVNSISYGKMISSALVDSLVKSFAAKGFKLEIKPQSPSPLTDYDIAIYHTPSQQPPAKPVLYIQYNNTANRSQAQRVANCLNQGIYNVPGVELRANFSRNEIRYYNDSFRDSIAGLQTCLRSVYPNKTFYPVKVRSGQSAARAEIWIYDSIRAPVIDGRQSYQLGINQFRNGKYAEALKHFNDAITNNYAGADVYYYRGQCYTALRQPDLACKDYKAGADRGNVAAKDLYDKNCQQEAITPDDILKNVVLHRQRNFNDKSGTSYGYTYYLTGDKKYLDKIGEVRYNLPIRAIASSTERANRFAYKAYRISASETSLQIDIITTEKGYVQGDKRVTAEPDIGNASVDAEAIANSIQVHVGTDSADKNGNQVAYTYYVTGDKIYLDAIAEVRYVRQDKVFTEFTGGSYISSVEKRTGFSFKRYQPVSIDYITVTIIATDKTVSQATTKTLIHDPSISKSRKPTTRN